MNQITSLISKNALSILRLIAWTGFFFLGCATAMAAGPVEFTFRLPANSSNPFARELWAEISTPAGKKLRLPAFYVGHDIFAVRARASEAGEYQLGRVTEKTGNAEKAAAIELVSARKAVVESALRLLPVGLDPASPTHFALVETGAPYSPIGANLAWASEGRVEFYERVLPQFSAEGLNWTRIWMAHWSGLNLDWRPNGAGDSPAIGQLDLNVAQDWDRIVATAEQAGVYFQLVLQHHGQYSSSVNPNWESNPWNAAKPSGFLKTPRDFFTSKRAIELTKTKYRYIVARWGYSPAILAWELFNEVHWVDPINRGNDEALVGRWHSEMADYLRSIDVYGHFVTTSTENLQSPIYARMDYLQPHLYPYAILSGPLGFNLPFKKISRPIFYGETGDDHAPLDEDQKKSGIAIVPPVWASLMGQGCYAAQPWLGEQLVQSGRLGELGAVARFVSANRLGERAELRPFAPQVECAETIPYVVEASHVWQKRSAPDFTLPLDGRTPVELADVPRVLVGSPKSLASGLPGRISYRVDFPRETNLRARFTGIGGGGSAVRIRLNGKVVAEKSWAAHASDAPRSDQPVELTFRAPAGPQSLVVENPGAKDWFQLDDIATDLAVAVIAGLGKRSENFLAIWLWHRSGVFSLKSPAPVGGALVLDDVPAGKWTVTWWDTIKGIPASGQSIDHGGGQLRLPIPALNRHSAVVLTR